MLQRLICSKFSTLVKSNLTIFNNNFSLESSNQTMMMYVINVRINIFSLRLM